MPDHNTIVLSEAECSVGLSEAHLQQARELHSKWGYVTLQNIWTVSGSEDIERRTAQVLYSLPQDGGYIHIKRRSLLPQEIASKRVRRISATSSMIQAQKLRVLDFIVQGCFPRAKLLQLYARNATRTDTLSIKDEKAIAGLLFQIVVPLRRPSPVLRLQDEGGFELAGHGNVVVRDREASLTITVDSKDYAIVTLDYDMLDG
ncbi:uncharacterized protein Z519_11206 [Cladophialophora bantiana CBS 173.52]|uniref:Uncharacterized protein n=1 Tax=Cladophialophora bantiana (strain ATCC 10958 / CBS 173.52 / CDC B-1940 / NIH 8579) TaxID=1442370 RepID=A0A0D2EDB4_CLAB1|nr:uncharacterized protein Z519_11206 [Cladophialophora bantiana CBS 173.52]KIW88096.1 hypothetical protein Z519_11206 [Cladophialophora bantiana CBS 173.52]